MATTNPLAERAALAADPDVARHGGEVRTARQLGDTYGVTDVDGSRPGCWNLIADHGIGAGGETLVSQYR